MTTYDEREKAFEKKFAMDADLRFKARSRRAKMVAEWAAVQLGITGPAVEDYVRAARHADLAGKDGGDLFAKLKGDLAAKGVKVPDADLHRQMDDFLAKAVADLEGGGKK